MSLTEAKVLGMALMAVFAVIIDEVGLAMKSDGDVRARITALRPEIESALDRMAGGFRLADAERS